MSQQFLLWQLSGQDFQFPGSHQPYNRRFICFHKKIHKHIRHCFHIRLSSCQALRFFQQLLFYRFMEFHQHLEKELFFGLIKQIKGPFGNPHPPDQFIYRGFPDPIGGHAVHSLLPKAFVNIFSFLFRISFGQGHHLFLTIYLILVIIVLPSSSVKP